MCDASALAAALLDSGADGRWAAEALGGQHLAAPSLLAFATANVIRRLELAGRVGSDQAAQAHADLLDLAVELWPYELVAARVWQLRASLSAYDASFVAVAELIGAPLLTLDRAIVTAPGVACAVVTPS